MQSIGLILMNKNYKQYRFLNIVFIFIKTYFVTKYA